MLRNLKDKSTWPILSRPLLWLGSSRLQLALRTVQLKACDAGKATDVAKLLQEAKEANDPVRGTATVGRVEVTSYETL